MLTPGPDQARDTPPGTRRSRELTLFEALIAQRMLNRRVRERVDGPAYVLWSVLLDSTLGFQHTSANHFHGWLAAEAQVTPKTVSRAIKTLVTEGFIAYESGYASEGLGKNVPSRFTILHVDEVLAEWFAKYGKSEMEGVPPRQGVPPEQSPPVPPEEGAPSSLTREDGTDSPVGTVPPEKSTYRGKNMTEENVTAGNDGGRVRVVPLKRGPTPSPVTTAPDAVLEAYCEAMREAGTPVAKPGPLLTGIKTAMQAGYSPRLVLIGLGMWEAEGYRHPKQIPEWVEKAARQGSEPSHSMAATDLLLEGQGRYQQYLVRRELKKPSKADVRQAQSVRAITRFVQGR